jgi:hypothetical protein
MLRQAIPEFPLPLKELSEVVMVDLRAIVQGIYERGGYSLRIDHHQPVPPPALSAEDQLWVNELLSLKGTLDSDRQ